MSAWENVPRDPIADDEQIDALLAEKCDWTGYDLIIVICLGSLVWATATAVGWVAWEILR